MKKDFLAHFLWKVDESRLDAGYATTTGGKKDQSFTWITWRPVITMSSPIESTVVRVPKTARTISQELGELGGNRISECFPVQPLPLVANGVDTHQTSSKCSAICWNLLRCPLKHQASLQTVMKDLRNCSNSMNSLNTRVLVQSPPFYPPANSNHLADRRLGLETPMESHGFANFTKKINCVSKPSFSIRTWGCPKYQRHPACEKLRQKGHVYQPRWKGLTLSCLEKK